MNGQNTKSFTFLVENSVV